MSVAGELAGDNNAGASHWVWETTGGAALMQEVPMTAVSFVSASRPCLATES
jgi:hypothetical protein